MEASKADERRDKRANPLGATGRTLAANLRRIRDMRGWSTAELARRLEAAGRPMPVTAITKLELGQRRCDADDLTALAVVLGVGVASLLLPPVADDNTPAEITGAPPVASRHAWRWMDGKEPLIIPDDDAEGEWYVEWQRLARPKGKRSFRLDLPASVRDAVAEGDLIEVAPGQYRIRDLRQPRQH